MSIGQVSSASLHCDGCNKFICEVAATGAEFKILENVKVKCPDCGGRSIIKTEEDGNEKDLQGLPNRETD